MSSLRRVSSLVSSFVPVIKLNVFRFFLFSSLKKKKTGKISPCDNPLQRGGRDGDWWATEMRVWIRVECDLKALFGRFAH